ncbi:septum formation initiator family protein [Microbaculum marinum]|uniref:Septum formation initiator family protein n=1 Tax=Microbaculum marinum TaxID=1764581 RepID=A0AAW9RWB7_9HYPH
MARRTVRYSTAGILIPIIGIAVIGYFVYHGLNGARGFWASQQREAEVAVLEKELADLRKERDILEQHVALLRPESLDPDMLEERARVLLNVAHPNDIVIMRAER